jgi:hypothetical protein
MSEAISGSSVAFFPGYRFAHPGYDCLAFQGREFFLLLSAIGGVRREP